MAALRFAADRMLGHLVTWLRLIDQDTTYGPHLHGLALLRHAQVEERTILTRDRRALPLRTPGLLVTSDHFRDQLKQVIEATHLEPLIPLFNRCPRCNNPVVTVPKPTVWHQVPPYVFATQERFVRCPGCHRIYWAATHQQRVHEELRRLGIRLAACTVG